jgi:hypothetical protein
MERQFIFKYKPDFGLIERSSVIKRLGQRIMGQGIKDGYNQGSPRYLAPGGANSENF